MLEAAAAIPGTDEALLQADFLKQLTGEDE